MFRNFEGDPGSEEINWQEPICRKNCEHQHVSGWHGQAVLKWGHVTENFPGPWGLGVKTMLIVLVRLDVLIHGNKSLPDPVCIEVCHRYVRKKHLTCATLNNQDLPQLLPQSWLFCGESGESTMTPLVVTRGPILRSGSWDAIDIRSRASGLRPRPGRGVFPMVLGSLELLNL